MVFVRKATIFIFFFEPPALLSGGAYHISQKKPFGSGKINVLGICVVIELFFILFFYYLVFYPLVLRLIIPSRSRISLNFSQRFSQKAASVIKEKKIR